MKQRGFTLLEVMVALSICATAGLAVMQLMGEHIDHLSMVKEQTHASWVAENRLVELSVQNTYPPKDKEVGQSELQGRQWHWRQIVKKTQTDDMVEVTVEVATDAKFNSLAYELRTFISRNEGAK